MSAPTPAAPEKLPGSAIFALFDGAPFGRLATYAPPGAARPGHCYVVPLQFLHREGLLYIITMPGRKLSNLRAAPRGVCFQLDLTEGAGWTSVCGWGDYADVGDLGERMSALSASFSKYPDRTTRYAVSWLRQHTPGRGRSASASPPRIPVIGRLTLTAVSGRYWPGALLSAGPRLVHPGRGLAGGERERPVPLSRADCWAVLAARPLARVACYHPARGRLYCYPLWYALEGNALWFYHPPGDGTLLAALREHPQGVCAQVDNLDCSSVADVSQPWRSVVAEGVADVFPLSGPGALPPARQQALLRAIRARLRSFDIRSVFVPPDPDLVPPQGYLLRLRAQALTGQATGTPR